MNSYRNAMVVHAIIMTSACLLLAACAEMYTSLRPTYDINGITAVQKSNGGVIKITAARKIEDVTAWLGDDNWLYITIPDTSIDARRLGQLEKSPMVAKTEFFRYTEAVQLTLQLRKKMDHVEIVRSPDNDNIYVVLYTSKSNS